MVRDRRNRANPPGNYIYGFTRVSRHMACCLVHSMMVATPEFGSSNHLVILNALGFRQPTRPGCGRFGTSYPLVVRLAARLYKWNIWKNNWNNINGPFRNQTNDPLEGCTGGFQTLGLLQMLQESHSRPSSGSWWRFRRLAGGCSKDDGYFDK